MDPRPTDPPDDIMAPFLRLLAQNETWLTTYVHTLVNRTADADDILQECKLTMWKHFGSFQPGTHFRAWARTIATHQVLNYRRTVKRLPDTALEESFIEAVAGEIDRRADQLDQRTDVLRRCVQQLPDAYRKIVIWRYYEEAEIETIAEKSRRTPAAVYRLLSRIRKLLNDCVSQRASLQPGKAT